MKWNKYNFIRKKDDNEYILYNSSTDKFLIIEKEDKQLIVDSIDKVNRIEGIHAELYYKLRDKQFVVEDYFNEVEDVIHKKQQMYNTSNCFRLIINPTLDCNLRCWYCYQTHLNNSMVKDETLKSILCLIKNKAKSSELNQIFISFFGGEPLMKFNNVVWRILEYAKKKCVENKKELLVSFTTNGVLLTQQIVDKLYAAELPCHFQVAFDGNEEFHNKTKKFANGKGSYETTINNVMYGLSKGFVFTIRCNYTPENLHTFDEVISLFKDVAEMCIEHGLLKFDFHRVWQVDETSTMEKSISMLENKASSPDKEKKRSKDSSVKCCYADNENSIVINYNGDVYNCTARDFNPQEREGYLNTQGIVVYNEKHSNRMKARFSNPSCLKCKIFPICYVCSQKKLDMGNISCFKMFTEEDKEAILLERIQMVSKNNG